MHRIRPYVLPIAIVLGLLFHTWCGLIRIIVPYLVFSILLLNFAAVDVKAAVFEDGCLADVVSDCGEHRDVLFAYCTEYQ